MGVPPHFRESLTVNGFGLFMFFHLCAGFWQYVFDTYPHKWAFWTERLKKEAVHTLSAMIAWLVNERFLFFPAIEFPADAPDPSRKKWRVLTALTTTFSQFSSKRTSLLLPNNGFWCLYYLYTSLYNTSILLSRHHFFDSRDIWWDII